MSNAKDVLIPPEQSALPGSSSGLSPGTIEQVKRSWARVQPMTDVVTTLFYGRLFERSPSLGPLFEGDLVDRKLMHMLDVAVERLHTPAKLEAVLEGLGTRHVGYLLFERHSPLASETLLWTLRESLGDGFTRESEAAWTEACAFLASAWKRAALASTAREAGAPAPSPSQEDSAVHERPMGADGRPRSRVPFDSAGQEQITLESMVRDDEAPTARGSFIPRRASAPGPAAPAPSCSDGLGPAPPTPSTRPKPGASDRPVPGEDLTVHVRLHLSPTRAAEPRAPLLSYQGVMLALLCVAASIGSTLLLRLNARADDAQPDGPLYGVMILALLLALGIFCFKHYEGRNKAATR